MLPGPEQDDTYEVKKHYKRDELNSEHLFYDNYTPWNFVQGGGGLIPEMIQVCDYDILIVLVELNKLI